MNTSRKKATIYKEASEERGAKYGEKVQALKYEELVYIDETWIEENKIQEKCGVKKGVKFIEKILGNRRGRRVSVISGLNQGKFIGAGVYEDTADVVLFILGLEKSLLPELRCG